LVIDERDDAFREGRAGLAKFRDTEAEFKGFRIAAELPPTQPAVEELERVDRLVEDLPRLAELTPEAFEGLVESPATSQQRIRRQAEELEQRAKELRRMAAEVARRDVCRRLSRLVESSADDFPLLEACLLIAQLDDPEVDVAAYLRQVDRMAAEIRANLPDKADRPQRLKALDKYLFEQNGFHGSRYEYYHAANSHMHRVIDDRVGLPITLSVLYMDLARRLDVELLGIGLPGHFVVRLADPPDNDMTWIDVFHEGRRLSRADAAKRVRETAGVELVEEHLEPVSGKQILLRVLGNLRGLAERRADREAMLRYLDAQLAIEPEDVAARGARSIILFETGRHAASLDELDEILRQQPAGLDLERIRQLRDYFERRASQPQAATR
jgi:regulator of sirC expression with transglutaminase-like and TPR domain